MNTVVRRARDEDLPVIKNLVPYYVYDISGHMRWRPDAEGHYGGCDDLPEYCEKPDHHPYLITVDKEMAGFAMVRPYAGDPERTEIGEFFVLRVF